MDFGLDLIMNKNKSRKKIYNVGKLSNFQDLKIKIQEKIIKELDTRDKNIDDNLILSIVNLTLDIINENKEDSSYTNNSNDEKKSLSKNLIPDINKEQKNILKKITINTKYLDKQKKDKEKVEVKKMDITKTLINKEENFEDIEVKEKFEDIEDKEKFEVFEDILVKEKFEDILVKQILVDSVNKNL